MRDRLLLVLTTCLGVLLSSFWLAGSAFQPALTQPENSILRVASSGVDAPGCGVESDPCRTVQYAVDQAQEGYEIRVASGVYTDVHVREAITQVVYISKTIDILGGFTTTNWITPDLESNPTTLDAQGLGRVMVVSRSVTVTLHGLRITGGNATGLGGYPTLHYPNIEYEDSGGGIYIHSATMIISACAIYSNTGSHLNEMRGYGGGVFLWGSQNSQFISNSISNNIAAKGIDYPLEGRGGGLYLIYSNHAVISGNLIQNNIGGYGTGSYGGGVALYYSDHVTMTQNEFSGNIASTNLATRGGGVYTFDSDHILFNQNKVHDNYASSYQGDEFQVSGGGGLFFEYGAYFSIQENEILSNTSSIGSRSEGHGGGILLLNTDHVLLEKNLVIGNIASYSYYGSVGGIWMGASDALLISNTIHDNIASIDWVGFYGGMGFGGQDITVTQNIIVSNTASLNSIGYGGGLDASGTNVLLDNNLIANNFAGKDEYSYGGGIVLGHGVINATKNKILNNASGGDGGGIYIDRAHGILIDNDILSNTAEHAGGGIFVYTFTWGTQNNLNHASPNLPFPARFGSPELDFDTTFGYSPASTLSKSDEYPGSGSDALIVGNRIVSNTAHQVGGGVMISDANVTLINNFIADNYSGDYGSGVVLDRSPAHHGNNQMLLIHNTIARNHGGDGSGVYIGKSGEFTSTAVLTNTILVSHTIGITVGAGSRAALEATLWGTENWTNDSDWGGAGTIHTGTINIWGDPGFLDPAAGDYHLSKGSAAINRGIPAGVDTDIDGEVRPFWFAYDIGADEAWLDLFIQYFPFVAKMHYP